MIDTHTHLYSREFDKDRREMLDRANAAGVTRMLLPNIDAESIDAMHGLVDEPGSRCLPMMGLHPTSVDANWQSSLEIVKDWLFGSTRRYVGVGEIGLDYYWDKTYVAEQQAALRRQLEWAALLDLPFSMHTRNATDDCINIVQDVQRTHSNLRGVFHCFGGSVEQAQRIAALGCLVGIGGVVTNKKSGLDVTLQHVDLKHIVLETDAPYLAPVPHRGKRNEPAYLVHVVEALASIYRRPSNEVERATDENATKMFRLTTAT